MPCGSAELANDRVKRKKEAKRSTNTGSCLRAEKAVENKGAGDTYCSWCALSGYKGTEEETGGIGDYIKNQHHQHHSTTKQRYLEEFWRPEERCYLVDWLVGWLVCWVGF